MNNKNVKIPKRIRFIVSICPQYSHALTIMLDKQQALRIIQSIARQLEVCDNDIRLYFGGELDDD